MKSLVLKYLEESIFFPYLTSDISELSFNGKEVYLNYVNKIREKLDLEFNNEQAYEFVRHIADLTGKNFNNTNPILDVSFANYRFNAVHSSVASSQNEPAITFIIRIIYPGLRIKEDDESLCPKVVHALLKEIVKKNYSIMISGVTGSGKSELQKYLISLIPKSQRIVMIEDTYETHIKELIPGLDINVWLAKNQTITYHDNLQMLIKAGLRNNPDWLMISEVRGSEMLDLLQTMTSGLAIITTIHAQSALDTPDRMLQLLSENKVLNIEQIKKEIFSHLHFYLHMKKVVLEDGTLKRYLGSIAVAYESNSQTKIYEIYSQDQHSFTKLDEQSSKLLNIPVNWFERG
ncbi:MAG: CpaF/VirB11 family protein [Bacilli bacterium]|nr:CpaF/VirB11 family protein [Bacilli bacterium]MDD4065852.1 CpaF/VirB11 family protein [Bacilli bacterium]